MAENGAEAEPRQADHAQVHVIESRDEYLTAVETIAGGHGPIAIDAERASGYRYSQRAYLIQIFRRGAGTFLFDPPAIGPMGELNDAIAAEEWILHAASQDLTCLREVGLDPTRLFDTELAARLAGLPKVGLGAVVAELLGIHLAKEHSAADWSTRPLPQAWLVYAALDVELLVDLREALGEVLASSNKTDIAAQEFASVLRETSSSCATSRGAASAGCTPFDMLATSPWPASCGSLGTATRGKLTPPRDASCPTRHSSLRLACSPKPSAT